MPRTTRPSSARCGCAVAVDNALPSVKAKADLVVADHGAGVVELARLLTETDLRSPDPRPQAATLARASGPTSTRSASVPSRPRLITGSSGAGKSTVVTALLEQMRDLAFQFCVVDPEGDYSELPDAVVVGDAKQEPRIVRAQGPARQAGRQRRSSTCWPSMLPNVPAFSPGSCPRSPSCAPKPGDRIGSSSTRPITACRPSGTRLPSRCPSNCRPRSR